MQSFEGRRELHQAAEFCPSSGVGKISTLARYQRDVDRLRTIDLSKSAQPLLRPANDSLRPLSTVELPLAVRPAPVLSGTAPVWRLDPQYTRWLNANFPHDPVWLCPLEDYDRDVRPADARFTLEQLHDRLQRETAHAGGYALSTLNGWRRRTAMFAVGSHRLKALTEFLFAFG